jgi:AraC-like DNA-binding protein
VCRAHHGLYGLYVPVVKEGRCASVLQVGVFLRRVPSARQLVGQWQALSGHPLGRHDDRFLDYARAVVDTPILEPPLVEGLRRLLEAFAGFLGGSLEPRAASDRMEALQREVFAPRLWHRQWADWQVLRPRFFRGDVDPRSLMQWEREELGIQRFPSVVMAAKREGGGREWEDWLGSLAFQRESMRLARGMVETLAYPLDNFGVMLLTSPTPGLSPARAERELRDKAAAFNAALSARLGCRIWAGIGRATAEGISLNDSYAEAVAALHLAVARDQPAVHYQDLAGVDLSETDLRHRIAALTQSFFESGKAPASHHRSVFVQEVLIVTRGRPEATRRVFMETLHHLLSALEARRSVALDRLAQLESAMTLQIETAVNSNEMVGRFEACLAQLLALLEQPDAGDKALRLRQAAEAIGGALHEPWTLPMAAARFGFSPSVFSKEFARQTGLPFSDHLLARRLEKAQRLLKDGLAPKQVAEACGFRSVVYFRQIFKRKLGLAPGQFSRPVGISNDKK